MATVVVVAAGAGPAAAAAIAVVGPLEAAGHRVVSGLPDEQVVGELCAGRADLLVVALAAGDQLDELLGFVRRVARGRERGPVIVAVAPGDDLDAGIALDAGADDYVAAPYRSSDLLARVRVALRPRAAPQAGDVEIDPTQRVARVAGRPVELTPKEFDLLRVLVRDQGSVVRRETIMREVWGLSWWGASKTLDVHVSSLRRKLGDDPADPRHLVTVRGVGFRFEP